MFLLISPLPPEPYPHSYKGLNSSTLQTISDYKLLSTSAGGSGVQLVQGKREDVYSAGAAADNPSIFLRWPPVASLPHSDPVRKPCRLLVRRRDH